MPRFIQDTNLNQTMNQYIPIQNCTCFKSGNLANLKKTLKYSKLMTEPNVKGKCVSKQFNISKNEKPATFYIIGTARNTLL